MLLTSDRSRQSLTERFALYLRTYPNVRLRYDGQAIDTLSVIENVADYDLEVTGLERKPAKLPVIEWKFKVESKKLFLCDG